MSESTALIRFRGGTMPRPYSGDLRARVIEEIATGASRREAAERYGISASVVVIWAQRWKQTGSFMAKPSGGSISPLEDHAEFLLVLIAKQPDLTLDEIVAATEKRGIECSRTAVWRVFDRSNSVQTWSGRAGVGCRRKVCLIRPDWCLSTKPARTLAWCGFAAVVRAESG